MSSAFFQFQIMPCDGITPVSVMLPTLACILTVLLLQGHHLDGALKVLITWHHVIAQIQQHLVVRQILVTR